MICTPLILLGAMQAAPPSVVEYREPGAQEVSIQLIARLPRPTERQVNAEDDLVAELARDVDGYSHHDMMMVTNGGRIRVSAGPGYLLVAFKTPPTSWRAGLSLMAALAKDSKLTPPEKPIVRSPDAWTFALNPVVHSRTPKPGDVEALYRAVFRPDNITLAVGGPVVAGAATADWQKRMANWSAPRLIVNRYDEFPKAPAKSPTSLDAIGLKGPPFGAGDAALPTRVLALFALGSGKGASLFRIARQKLQYSYRQEALLYPDPEGWRMRIQLLKKPQLDAAGPMAILRPELIEDVSNWTEADRMRALGMAEAVFMRDVDFSPFAFGPDGAIPGTLEGRTFLRAYWQMKTGTPWDAPSFMTLMRSVQLDDLKASATEFLTQAQATTLPASP